MNESPVTTVVFDLGNVLIRWDPRLLYSRLLPDATACDRFLAEVCTHDWNLEQDRGRDWAEAIAERVALFPEQESLIRAFDLQWHEMLPGPVPGSVEILEELHAAGTPLYAITNFSHKYDETLPRFPFLERFLGVVVSARERLVKPDPAIYRLLLERYGLDARHCVFVDDAPRNVEAARSVGMQALRFSDAPTLRRDLRALGLPLATGS